MSPELVQTIVSVIGTVVVAAIGAFGYQAYKSGQKEALKPSPIDESDKIVAMAERMAENFRRDNDVLRAQVKEQAVEIRNLQERVRVLEKEVVSLGGDPGALNGK